MSKRVALYIRVSTKEQTTENQRIELLEICRRNNYEVVEIYDETVSGTKDLKDRPELKRLLKEASQKKFEKLIIWSVDRLGRNLKNIIGVLSTLHESGIEVFSYKQGIDTSTTMGRSFMAITGIFAEIENDLRKERQSIGIKRAIAQGAKFGRKPKVNDRIRDEVVTLRSEGMSYRNIGKELGLTATTVQRAYRQATECVT